MFFVADKTGMEAPAFVDVIKAANFAAKKHSKQRRGQDGDTPYINHPIEVAHILWNEGRVTDIDVFKAAILHDTGMRIIFFLLFFSEH